MFKNICMIIISGLLVFGINTMSFAAMCHSQDSRQQIAQSDTGHDSVKTDTALPVVTKDAVAVDNQICPVSDVKIDEKTKATYEHEGMIYNFCCAMCIDEFKKDPEKYIKKVEEELQAKVEDRSGQPK